MGDPGNGGHCVPCLEFCNGHSQFCYHIDHFNGTPTSQLYAEDSRWPQFTLAKQLETARGPLAEEAVCVNCGQMTIGKKCDHCKLGYFGGAANGQSECKACDCNGHGDTCDEVSGIHSKAIFFFDPRCSILRISKASHCLKIIQNVAFEFWHFPPIFVLLKLTCLVTLFDRKLQVFKNLPNRSIFGIFNELLSTRNVNVARFARNVE